jgi:hypothetical protein
MGPFNMFDEQRATVFILGAGASWHYGYPTGEKLIKLVANKAARHARSDTAVTARQLFALFQNIACRVLDRFFDRAGPVALPWEIQCRHTRGIRLLYQPVLVLVFS